VLSLWGLHSYVPLGCCKRVLDLTPRDDFSRKMDCALHPVLVVSNLFPYLSLTGRGPRDERPARRGKSLAQAVAADVVCFTWMCPCMIADLKLLAARSGTEGCCPRWAVGYATLLPLCFGLGVGSTEELRASTKRPMYSCSASTHKQEGQGELDHSYTSTVPPGLPQSALIRQLNVEQPLHHAA
jgi:hypothetical protein